MALQQRGGGRSASSKGASEHETRGGGASRKGAPEHEFALAFTNIGLVGAAINGKKFKKRFAKKLVDLFTSLLTGNKNCAGLLICEAGNIGNTCTDVGKAKMN